MDDNDNENNQEADGVSTSASASASIIASASDVSLSVPIVTEKVSSEEANFNAWIDKLKVQYKWARKIRLGCKMDEDVNLKMKKMFLFEPKS